MIDPWLTLSVFGAIYLLSSPWSWASYLRMRQKELDLSMSDEQE